MKNFVRFCIRAFIGGGVGFMGGLFGPLLLLKDPGVAPAFFGVLGFLCGALLGCIYHAASSRQQLLRNKTESGE